MGGLAAEEPSVAQHPAAYRAPARGIELSDPSSNRQAHPRRADSPATHSAGDNARHEQTSAEVSPFQQWKDRGVQRLKRHWTPPTPPKQSLI